MKKTLMIARILTWFNLIFWGGFLGLLFLAAMAIQFYPALVGVFLFCAIPLHSYASLQLQKSIRFPNVKLSNNTPVGVRFVGLVALFFGIYTLVDSFVILKDPLALLDLLKKGMPDVKKYTDAELLGGMHLFGVAGLVLGLAVVVNVVLNTRLLRWYYLVKQSDVS
jgi:hypothetical protein